MTKPTDQDRRADGTGAAASSQHSGLDSGVSSGGDAASGMAAPVVQGSDGSAIRSLTGTSLKGAPLAMSRPAKSDVQPWFYWITLAEGQLPTGAQVRCGMLGDHACIRLLYGGTWTADTADGPMVFEPGDEGMTLYFGPQSRYMPISVTGSYKVITLQSMAGTPHAMRGPSQVETLDRVLDFDALVGHGRLTSKIRIERDHESWASDLEAQVRKFVALRQPPKPDPVTIAFERECLASPDFSIRSFAAAHGIGKRTLERQIKRDFGLTPRRVLRRARALDMAASLLGLAAPDENEAMHLRYFDQSHLIREIRQFFGMRPRDLRNGLHPLLSLNIETRQSRRFAAINAIDPQARRPWRDPATEPPGR